MNNGIDIVIPWVDGNDPEWIKEKEIYSKDHEGDKNKNRYRDWDNLQYVFRGIEKNLPWIRKIHFITWGHIPPWMNTKHPKLNIVRHEDYIPKEYLPTFSSHPIEMNMHRIKNLSDKFIYTNDDFFFLRSMKENDFFIDNLPCDLALESVHQFRKGGIDHIVASNLEVLNDHFNKRECIKKHHKKFYSLRYGKGLLKNLYVAPFGNFTGFENQHLPIPYLKETFEEIWKEYPEVLDHTSRNKFRFATDVNQWLARYWQFASGKFYPIKKLNGQFLVIGKDDERIKEIILNKKYAMICLSDDDVNVDFEYERNFLIECFEKIFPEKSSYEI